MNETDDVMAALEFMDTRWKGYQESKNIIRDEIVRLREENAQLCGYDNYAELVKEVGPAPVKGE